MSLAAETSDAAKSQAWPKDDLRLLGNIKGLIASCHDDHPGYAQHLYVREIAALFSLVQGVSMNKSVMNNANIPKFNQK